MEIRRLRSWTSFRGKISASRRFSLGKYGQRKRANTSTAAVPFDILNATINHQSAKGGTDRPRSAILLLSACTFESRLPLQSRYSPLASYCAPPPPRRKRRGARKYPPDPGETSEANDTGELARRARMETNGTFLAALRFAVRGKNVRRLFLRGGRVEITGFSLACASPKLRYLPYLRRFPTDFPRRGKESRASEQESREKPITVRRAWRQ